MTSYDHLDASVREALEHDLTIDITTTGRHSGSARRIEIWFVNVAGDIYIVGTPGPRGWLANLMANGRLVVHLKQSIRVDLDAIAVVVRDPTERRRVFESGAARWYRKQQPLDELVAAGPVVRLEFE